MMQMRTFSHEMDHALKLQHPKDETAGMMPMSVMCDFSGYPSNFGVAAAQPTNFDRTVLQVKWGKRP